MLIIVFIDYTFILLDRMEKSMEHMKFDTKGSAPTCMSAKLHKPYFELCLDHCL